MKNRKSPGGIGRPGELFKNGGEALLRKLHDLILAVWETEAVPNDCKDSIITSIYENMGDRAECGNSKGISL